MESGSSKISVAETGNKRAVLSNEDINQALNDISQWFKSNDKEYFDNYLSKGGASADEIKATNAPEHVQLLLLKFNGGMQFMDTFRGLSVSEIKQTSVGAGLTPFAKDIDTNVLCVNQAGKVVTWDSEEKMVIEELSVSFGEYVVSVGNGLLSRKLVWEGVDLGLVSVQ